MRKFIAGVILFVFVVVIAEAGQLKDLLFVDDTSGVTVVGITKTSPLVASDTTLATQGAIKSYVDTSASARVPYSGATGNVALGANDLSARNASFTGTLGATGAATLGGALSVAGNATVTGRLISDSIKDVSGQGLVLGMNFNSASINGATALDSSTYANHGTISGATATATGGYNGGGYLSFDGVDDYVSIPDSDISDLRGSFSISTWIYMNNRTNSQYVIFKATSTAGISFRYNKYGPYWVLESKGPTGSDYWSMPYTSIPTGQWCLVSVTYSGGETPLAGDVKMYVNGTEQTVTPNVTGYARAYTTTPLMIGYSSETLDGKTDDVRIYNRALSAAEIKALYDSRQEVAMPKLSLYSPAVQHVYSDLTLHGVWSDLTPGWSRTPDEALSAIVGTKSIMGKAAKGKATIMEIDHASLPIEAQVVLGMDEATSEPVVGRNLGMMLTIQGEAIKALESRLKKLEGEKGVQK